MFQMNGELLNLINGTAEKVAERMVAEMKRNKLITEGRQTPFQKTETLLFNYNDFKAAIKDKEDQIREIREFGLRGKSKSITSFEGGCGLIEVKTDAEKAEEKIEAIEASIAVTRNFIKILDDAVDTLKDDQYYEIIPMRYFEKESMEEIAEHLYCDVSTVRRNKNRLINLLQIRLFSDEVIQQIFAV